MVGRGALGRERAETRLDPVRWRRPGRGSLLRLAVVATLLATAAAISWSGPETCTSAPPPAEGKRQAAPEADSPATVAPSAGGDRHAVPTANATAAAGGGAPPVPAGSVGVPVRLAEPAALTLVHPGDRIDLLSVDPSGGTTVVAAAALVLGVTGADDPTSGGLLVALGPDEARMAITSPSRAFAILIRPD